MSQSWEAERDYSSHPLISSARKSALMKQNSSHSSPGLKPMDSANLSPSPSKLKENCAKRSLNEVWKTPSTNDEPPTKRVADASSAKEPAFSKEKITEILKKHANISNESTDNSQSDVPEGNGTPIETTPALPKKKKVAPAPKPTKNATGYSKTPHSNAVAKRAVAKRRRDSPEYRPGNPPGVRPRYSANGPGSVKRYATSIPPACLAYMKEIDRGGSNGLRCKCKRPFDYYGDPEFKDSNFLNKYLPAYMKQMGLMHQSSTTTVTAAHFYAESVDLELYELLPEDYKMKEFSRHEAAVISYLELNSTPPKPDEKMDVSENPIKDEHISIPLAGDDNEYDDESSDDDELDTVHQDKKDIVTVQETPQPKLGVRVGGAGMNKNLVYPDDHGLLAGAKMPLELTINDFVEKVRRKQLKTYVPEAVAERICKTCMIGAKGRDPKQAWQSCFHKFCVYIVTKNPPYGYWKNVNGKMIIDRDLFKDCLIRTRGYLKAAVPVRDMVPTKYPIEAVHELHYMATRHFEFIFDAFKVLRKMIKKIDFPAPNNNYKFYLEVIDNARKNINKRKSANKRETKDPTKAPLIPLYDPYTYNDDDDGPSCSTTAQSRKAIVSEMDDL